MKLSSPLMILVLVASTPANAPEVEVVLEATKATDEVEECKDGVKDLKNGIEGLEFFLNDKKKHKEHRCNNSQCTYRTWKQPKLEQYKKKPKSYLPKTCEKKDN